MHASLSFSSNCIESTVHAREFVFHCGTSDSDIIVVIACRVRLIVGSFEGWFRSWLALVVSRVLISVVVISKQVNQDILRVAESLGHVDVVGGHCVCERIVRSLASSVHERHDFILTVKEDFRFI